SGRGAPRPPTWWLARVFGWAFERVSAPIRAAHRRAAIARADEAYGAARAGRGLRHLVNRAVHHRAHLDPALAETAKHGAPLANLYASEPAAPIDTDAEVAEALAEVADAETSAPEPEPEAGDDAFAWTLFEDREALERALTRRVHDDQRA